MLKGAHILIDCRNKKKIFLKIVLSIGVSLLLLATIFKLIQSENQGINRTDLLSVLSRPLLFFIVLYLICALAQALFRALRYKVLLQNGIAGSNSKERESLPHLFWIYLVTLTRNMFVDLFPSRTGELSYIAMMNRGYNVGVGTCTSSLVISVFFDFISLFFMMIGVLFYQLIWSSAQSWLYIVLGVLVLAMTFMGILVFWGFRKLSILFESLFKNHPHNRLIGKISNIITSTGNSIEEIWGSRIFTKTLLLSLGVRVFKYAGLYFLFLGLTLPSFKNLSEASPWNVFFAFISAEGAASLPIPSVMSFGTYESGGLLALKVLGFSTSTSAIAMLAIHIYSQAIDYFLGITSFLAFMFMDGSKLSKTPRIS